MSRTAAGLFIVGLLTFFATAAILLCQPQAVAPAPPAQQVDAQPSAVAGPLVEAEDNRSAEAERSAEAKRVNDDAAKARERRDAQERALQAGYQDDVRQLQAAQQRQAEQQLRAMELAGQAARQEQQARQMAADQAERQATQQQFARDQQRQNEQDQRALEARRVQQMLEQHWLYWGYPMPRLP
jgi:colicin import membrane protein